MANGFAIINRATGDAFTFQFTPQSVKNAGRANWNEQEVTAGIKPLVYGNSDPRRISFAEVMLDASDADESLAGDLALLRSLMAEADRSTPPELIYIRGGEQLRCVMTELEWDEVRFNRQGDPTRVKVSLTLIEKVRVERVTSRTTDPDDPGIPFGG
jgi:hypothetical protein